MNKINMGSIYGIIIDKGIDFDDPVKYYFPFNDKKYEINTLSDIEYTHFKENCNETTCKNLFKMIAIDTVSCYDESIYVMDEVSRINDKPINIFQRVERFNPTRSLTSTALVNYREISLVEENHTMDNIIDIYEYLYDQIECMGIIDNTGGVIRNEF